MQDRYHIIDEHGLYSWTSAKEPAFKIATARAYHLGSSVEVYDKAAHVGAVQKWTIHPGRDADHGANAMPPPTSVRTA